MPNSGVLSMQHQAGLGATTQGPQWSQAGLTCDAQKYPAGNDILVADAGALDRLYQHAAWQWACQGPSSAQAVPMLHHGVWPGP